MDPVTPAAQAGIVPGDLVVALAGDTIRHWGEMVRRVEPRAHETVDITLLRDGARTELRLTIGEGEKADRITGESRTAGVLGVRPSMNFRRVEFGLLGAVREGVRQTRNDLSLVLFTVRGLLFGKVSPRELGGPIVIGQLSGQAARLGPLPFLRLMAFISVNLAIFNLLPVPVLDGGHLIFLLLEGLRGRPVSTTVRLRLTQLGFALLMVLVVFVFYNDIARILR